MGGLGASGCVLANSVIMCIHCLICISVTTIKRMELTLIINGKQRLSRLSPRVDNSKTTAQIQKEPTGVQLRIHYCDLSISLIKLYLLYYNKVIIRSDPNFHIPTSKQTFLSTQKCNYTYYIRKSGILLVIYLHACCTPGKPGYKHY